MKIEIRGEEWQLFRRKAIFYNGEDHDGFCLFDSKTLLVHNDVKGREELETYVHELLHACQTDLSEEAVTDTAHSLASALWKVGYRR